VVANGKTDPAGPLYLRWYAGSGAKYEKAGISFHEAEIAQLRLERKLKAQSQGFTVPEEAPVPTSHRCDIVLTAYLAYLRATTKRNGRKYNERAILSRESNIQEFLKVTGRVHVEQIIRADLLRYKKFLNDQGRANDTVYNKLAVVVTWLKKNQIVEIKDLLKSDDWPIVRETKSHPFRATEITAMMEKAGPHQLLIRLARGTGMRKAELMHAERSDINPYAKSIHVKNKPRFSWETKTLAGVREIPLGENLLRDLLAMPEGLLFPNKHGQPDIRIDRRFQEVGEAAGVQPPDDDRACWVHRWRDTYATSLVRSRTLSDLDIARVLGHEDTSMLKIYYEGLLMESTEARAAANSVDEYGVKPPKSPIHIVKEKSNAA
jgi:integrase